MIRYKCIIAYDGSGFSGYQVQPNKRTVQGEFELVLARLHKESIKIIASGRTDSGVHARGQVIHFDSTLNLSCYEWIRAINSLLPKDIVAISIEEEDEEFHARYSVKRKEYRYCIKNTKIHDPFARDFVTQIKTALNIESMRLAIKMVIGTHDFSSFCASNTNVKNKVRTIYKADLLQEGSDCYVFSFVADGFLYNMVRIMVGTLLDIGCSKLNSNDIIKIMCGKDRRLAGKTAPPQGLYLWRVEY